MRLFVAVNPPERLVGELDTRLDTVRRAVPIAWTRPQAWHLTLMFLGEWSAQRAAPLAAVLQAAVAACPAPVITPGGVGAFPDWRRPRVLFLHLEGGARLEHLAGAVRGAVDAVWPEGPQDRRAFRPHLTLARIKRPLPAARRAILADLDLGPWPAFTPGAAHLLASELHPGGARYTEVARLELGG